LGLVLAGLDGTVACATSSAAQMGGLSNATPMAAARGSLAVLNGRFLREFVLIAMLTIQENETKKYCAW
jgi:hypothetical protein